ncbi:MAG: DUF4058 family protein [Isosphaeraceae bacterium]
MPSPFPGMDPYLENPEIFPDLHDSLITYIRENLQANLPPPYYAAIGRRVWIEASRRAIEPDVHVLRAGAARQVPSPTSGATAVASRSAARPVIVKVLHDEFREPFLEIYAGSRDSKRLVTSIEVLSLANKTPDEPGRELFLRKQRERLAGKVNLVEIDLLRKGHHSTAVPLEPALAACGPFDYHVSVHPFDDVETFYVYPMNLKEPLATIEVPLLPGDAAISLDLQVVFDRCYDAGPYAREVDYGESQIIPPLDANQAAWATAMLQNKRD